MPSLSSHIGRRDYAATREDRIRLPDARADRSRRSKRNPNLRHGPRAALFFAFIYKVIGVPIAAGVLYPRFGILLSPMLAAAAMSLSSISVIGNALRLRRLHL